MTARANRAAEAEPALPAARPVEILVCTTCRAPATDRTGEAADTPRPGAMLHARLSSGTTAPGVSVRAVECLSNCSRGCTVALRSPGRWTYVYGNLDPAADVDLVRDGAARYASASDGVVPWRERSEHFRKNCIARLPPLEIHDA